MLQQDPKKFKEEEQEKDNSERKKKKKTCFLPYNLHLNLGKPIFHQSKCLFIPSLPLIICMIFPLWNYILSYNKLVVHIQKAGHVLADLCF